MDEDTWWLADVVLRVMVEGEAQAAHVNLHLVRAANADEAYAKAVELGRESEDDYVRSDGRRVRTSWVGLASLNRVHEPLDDGAELGFAEQRAISDAALARLVRPREELAAFGGAPLADEAPAIVTLDHAQIMIAAGEEQSARELYCGLLGLVEIPKPGLLRARGGFWLEAGDRQLHVGVENPGAGVDRRATRAHVAFAVRGLDAFRARLVAAGVAIVDGEQPEGMRRFELRDPSGNRVELLERT
jgi:catechol 2,3-dioxygenase-like lactoylglutathione lyase family enzyme